MAEHTWTHAELCEAAKRYLLGTLNCGFAFSEFVTNGREIPDAIGFRSSYSVLIEAKTSRRDFHADKAKLWRRIPGRRRRRRGVRCSSRRPPGRGCAGLSLSFSAGLADPLVNISHFFLAFFFGRDSLCS